MASVGPVAAEAGKPQALTGKLVVPKGAGTKESYLTGNFQLLTKDARLILTGSKKVSEDKLLEFKGHFVTVEAVLVPEQEANPMEQAPVSTGPDGKRVLIKHPAHYEVHTIKAYGGKPFPVFEK